MKNVFFKQLTIMVNLCVADCSYLCSRELQILLNTID